MNEAETKAFDEWRRSKSGVLGTGVMVTGARAAWEQLCPELAVRSSIIKAQNIEIQKMKDQIEQLVLVLHETDIPPADLEMLEHVLGVTK